ncbi:MAG TPA: hypothetical protein EYP29_03555, partial [Thermoplasmata archaeon]|nr:hypothetical protein [Thermoplasmata archaeon]
EHGGNYTVVAEKEGYKAEDERVYVKSGEEKEVNFYLEKKESEKCWIFGYVKDKLTEFVLKHVRIIIHSLDYNGSYEVYTGEDGGYEIELEEGGNYTVRAEKEGYNPEELQLFLEAGDEKRVDFLLEKIRLPDLTVISLNISPERPVEGEIAMLNAKIKNIGDADAENITVSFYDNADGMLQVIKVIKTITKDRLPSGESWTIEVPWNTSGQKGENILWVTVDPDNKIDESNEENNRMEMEVEVRESTKLGVDITVHPQTIKMKQGEEATIAVIVKNIGAIRDNYTLKVEPTDYKNVKLDFNYNLKDLKPGESRSFNITIRSVENISTKIMRSAENIRITVKISVYSETDYNIHDFAFVSVEINNGTGEEEPFTIPGFDSPAVVVATVGTGALISFFRRRSRL